MSTLDADAQAVVAFLNAAASEHFLYESVGVFWLAAEVLILFAIREGRKQVAGESPSPWLPRLLLWMLAFAVPASLVLARQHVLPALPDAGEAPAIVAAYYTLMVQQHLAVWSLFVLGWVVLEAAIVVEGMRAYGHFTRLCRHALRPVAVVALCCMAWNITAQEPPPGPGMAALHEADAALQPLRNAVYLYLRLAGVAWIAIEWVAAVLLWRGQSLLWRVARERAHD